MVNLTFAEQVKVVLKRKGMTIKELAERVEEYTGKPMSRQNMTQRLGRDNFQEQDMRMIAEILGCPFTLSILDSIESNVEKSEQDIAGEDVSSNVQEEVNQNAGERDILRKGVVGYFRRNVPKQQEKTAEGDINPYTRKEYETNSVRMHPNKIGYVQVYDKEKHAWSDKTEWAFLGEQERKKKLLGKDYKPPIYLD